MFEGKVASITRVTVFPLRISHRDEGTIGNHRGWEGKRTRPRNTAGRDSGPLQPHALH